MKLEPWEPDLSSLYSRYKDGSLDLQPAFQRGLVWPREKKARLVDTVLRGWRIPPVHLVVEADESLSVLDGQQRLQALFDFLEGKVRVGSFPPHDDHIDELKGATFKTLPLPVQRRIQSARISTYRLYEFQPDEPHELFFRLNLPTGLTSAEKRNALTGETRRQIRSIVEKATSYGWDKELLGFSDGRLAYDDVVARLCAYIEKGTLATSLSPREMENIYRSTTGLSQQTVRIATLSVEFFTAEIRAIGEKIRLNKATLLTWLLVAARANLHGVAAQLRLADSIKTLEKGRALVGRSELYEAASYFDDPIRTTPLIALYADRSSLRVADVLSIQTRDAVAWLAVAHANQSVALPSKVRQLSERVGNLHYQGSDAFETEVLEVVSSWAEWSRLQ